VQDRPRVQSFEPRPVHERSALQLPYVRDRSYGAAHQSRQQVRQLLSALNWLRVWCRRWGALLVAVLALATSVWSGWEDRRHKRLSVKPQLTLSFSFHEGVSAGWMMSNAGLGPAIVQRFEAYVDDRPQIQWDSFADSLGIQRPHALGFANVYSLQIISPGLPEPLLTVRLDQSKPATARNLADLMNNFKRVRMEVCYCSLYDECWQTSTRWESWGSRKEVASCVLPKLGEATWFGNIRQQ